MADSDRPMSIAFAGASGTGKSTLAKAVCAEFNLSMNPIGSRSIAASMGFTNPYDVDRAYGEVYDALISEGHDPQEAASLAIEAYDQRIVVDDSRTMRAAFQHRLQREKIDWELATRRFVSDRSTIDDFCYSLMHSPMRIDETFIENAVAHSAKYDILFVTPMSSFFDTAGDPMRVERRGYHAAFETALLAIANVWRDGRVVVVDKTGVQERISMVISTVRWFYY